MNPNVSIEIVEGDALRFHADVLALKYAQANYGVDSIATAILRGQGKAPSDLRAKPGGFRLVANAGQIVAPKVLFVGVVHLIDFGYKEIRQFARRVLSSLAGAAPETEHVAVTVHGPGYGLDEIEAFESEIAGFLDAIRSSDIPRSLRKISVVEQNRGRVRRLQQALTDLLPSGVTLDSPSASNDDSTERLRAAGYASDSKRHIFVAMPFAVDMDDHYHYGIQRAVRASGFLCERADLSTFAGDVMQWVRDRIRTSALVVAVLTTANPNVYLEVGYAWGCAVPTILLVKETEELKFNVKGQRCLVYSSIRELESRLTTELVNFCTRDATVPTGTIRE